MRPKDALIKDGFPGVTAGRGRLSAAAKSRLQELANQGWSIDGYSSGKAVAEVRAKVAADPKVVQEFTIFWSVDEYRAVETDGKVRSMAEVCRNCHVSLVQCHCGDPYIVSRNSMGHVPVRIERL